MGFVVGLLWFLIVIVMLFLMGIILLQEGKGGGLAEAFGGAGAETFGVKASGINRLTGILGGVFLVLVVLVNLMIRARDDAPIIEGVPAGLESVEIPAAAGGPAEAGGDADGN